MMGDMVFQNKHLSASDTGADIAHAVVVPHLFMLIPWGGFPALCTPFTYLVRILLAVRQIHSPCASGQDFIPVEGEYGGISKLACLHAFIQRAE